MGLVAFIAFPLAFFYAKPFRQSLLAKVLAQKTKLPWAVGNCNFLGARFLHTEKGTKTTTHHMTSYDAIWWPPPIIWWPPPIIWWPPPIIWHHMMQYDGPCFWAQHFSYQKKPGFQNKMWQSMRHEKKKAPKVKETGNRKLTVSQFQNIRAIQAQSKRNGKFNSLVFASKLWRPKVKEPGNSIHDFSPQNFGGPNEMNRKLHSFIYLEAQSEGNRKFNSLAVPTLDFCRPKAQETGNSIH